MYDPVEVEPAAEVELAKRSTAGLRPCSLAWWTPTPFFTEVTVCVANPGSSHPNHVWHHAITLAQIVRRHFAISAEMAMLDAP